MFGWLSDPSATFSAIPVTPPRVLILAETVGNPTNSLEAAAAQMAIAGCIVDVVPATNWPAIPGTGLGGPTGYGFDSYRAIILGDPLCDTMTPEYTLAMNTLNATKLVWSPAVSGNVILLGVDNALHAMYNTNPIGPAKTLNRGIAFSVNDTNRTGLYYALSCFYSAVGTNPIQVPHLTGLGNFMVRSYGTCFEDAHIVATHPIFTAAPPLTDAELSDWSCSTHEGFDAWPPNYVVLAIALTNGTFTATDGSNGVPYILVRGEGVKVISSIDLTPPDATNFVGSTHTVCATLASNVFPRTGISVTFTISSGPNSVTNYTTTTDTNGVACFTYTGVGGPGTDYITASYVSSSGLPAGPGVTNYSDTVSKTWVLMCMGLSCENIDCLADGTYSYSFCVTNFSAQPMTVISLSNAPPGITFTPSLFNLSPILNPGQVTNLTVSISSTSGLSSFCFLLIGRPESTIVPPCTLPHCISLPTCCNRVISNALTFASASGITNTYNYQITVQNIGAIPVKFVAFGADQSCVSFIPPLVNLTLPVYGGPSLLFPSQLRTFTIQVQKVAPCPGSNSMYISLLSSNQTACCSTKMKLPGAPCVLISNPTDGAVALTNSPVLLRAIPNPNPVPIGPCGFGTVLFYQDATLVGVADHDPYQATFTPVTPGTFQLTAVALLSTGEQQTSDPVALRVITTDGDPNHHGP